MMKNQFTLLRQRRFAPFFATQFLGAFNDNFFKTMVSVLIAYGALDIGGHDPGMLVALAAGLFVVPFVLCTPLAGDMADKYDKSLIMRALKVTELVIVAVGFAALFLQSIPLLMITVLALGAQSAFFSPAKFSIIPQHLKPDELIGGNALVNTGTYLAILFGTILGSVLVLSAHGALISGAVFFVIAVLGLLSSLMIPPAPAPSPTLKLNYNTPREAWRILRYAYGHPGQIFSAMLAVSWFFFVGALYLSQFPNFTKQILGVDHIVLTFFMAVFSIGIALGGLLNNRLLKSEVSAKFVPFAALMMGVFSFDLYFASQPYADVPPAFRGRDLMGLAAFLSHLSGWRIVVDLLFIAVAGGLYAVPLKAIIQHRTPPDHCARVMAGSALMDALFVLASAALAIAAFALGYAVTELFVLVGAVSIIFALYTFRRVARSW